MRHAKWLLKMIWVGALSIQFAMAAAPTEPSLSQTPPPNDRLHEKVFENVTVTTAVPSAEETIDIFGADLYASNIQPVWVQVENRSQSILLFTPRGVDDGYYTAYEAGNRLPGGLVRWFGTNDKRIYRKYWPNMQVDAGSTRSGYVFSRVDQGTKTFNVDVVGGEKPYHMTFFVPVPGLRLDHYNIVFETIYPEDAWQDVDLDGLVEYLETAPCCVTGKKEKGLGDPLNIAFIGNVKDLYYTFLRAGWDETETVHTAALWKMMKSTLSGEEYRYSPVSSLYVFNRPQDVALQKARTSIDERNHMRLWLTPIRYEGLPLWIGQVSRDIGVHFTRKTITTHKIDPDVDETRDFLLEDLVYSQGVEKAAYVWGVGSAPYDEPRGNLTGDPYFTDGRRILMWISDNPVELDELQILDLGAQYRTTPGD